MSLEFTSNNPLLNVLLATVAAIGMWVLYRGECRRLATPPYTWVLPLLRSTAVFMAVLTLASPMLTFPTQNTDRLLIMLDNSESMNATDKHNTVDQKLLVAHAHGWLSEGVLDVAASSIADQISSARRVASQSLSADTSISEFRLVCRDFATAAAAIAKRSAESSQLHFQTVLDDFQRDVALPAQELTQSQIGVRDQLAARTRLVSLIQEATDCEQRLRSMFFDQAEALADSDNAEIQAALKKYDSLARWSRAEELMLKNNGIAREMISDGEVDAIGFSSETDWSSLFSANQIGELPNSLGPQPAAPTTDLASLSVGHPFHSSELQRLPLAVVLISDGRHNQGPQPTSFARALSENRIPTYVIGMGAENSPPDVSITDVRHAQVVFDDEQLRGYIEIADYMPAGETLALRIELGDELLWEQDLTTHGNGLRRISFDFAVDKAAGTEAAEKVLLKMKVTIPVSSKESRNDNNEYPMFVVKSKRPVAKVLIIDGRPRWESRYLRALFARNEQWQVNAILLQPGMALPVGSAPLDNQRQPVFPSEKQSLFNYDLIVIGDVASDVFSDEQTQWLSDFVAKRGGGMILLDGMRRSQQTFADTPLEAAIPIEWESQADEWLVNSQIRYQLPDPVVARTVLNLTSDVDDNTALWKTLPAPRRSSNVRALPGSQTLVELVDADNSSTRPAIVFRRFGAGRVLYCGFDETWRWRYKVGDRYHVRYWNQLARWLKEPPFAVSDNRVALDADALVIRSGDRLRMRARVKDESGQLVFNARAAANVWRDGQSVATFPVESDADSGLLRGESPPLEPGSYEISLQSDELNDSELSNSENPTRLPFSVIPQIEVEKSDLSANPTLLRTIAEQTGGVFLREDQAYQLPELIEAEVRQQNRRSKFVLWESYWWFSLIVLMLVVELYLRKRNGLP